jgi:hypothetical protein
MKLQFIKEKFDNRIFFSIVLWLHPELDYSRERWEFIPHTMSWRYHFSSEFMADYGNVVKYNFCLFSIWHWRY